MRRSPPVVDQPVSGMAGPPSGTPTLWAPATGVPSTASWASVGVVIRKPSPAPARARTAAIRIAQVVARSATRDRKSRTATASVAVQSTTTVTAMAL
ncbi:hypothetical protein GCM10010425_07090 [Streptomyces spororaveus]|uniref:Uncharacterized protein n=1 Tax=Streptomyces spororaveus TaxID=284039 RepID=A0ABQ3TF20_9ACTN|nr:hypothetical protein Sspor_45220 [Streptomyces spororaveus]